jgi:cytochrome c oxidase subunit 2
MSVRREPRVANLSLLRVARLAALVAVLGSGGAHGDAAGAGDADAGARWYTVCGACHGARGEGIAALSTPRLSGMPVSYLVEQLDAFRSGRRGAAPDDEYGRQMISMAAILPDVTAFADVAAYIRTFPVIVGSPTPSGGNAEQGRQLYQPCAACHGVRAQGIALQGAPPLAGQDATYLVRQLQAFKSRVRGGPRDGAAAQTMAAAAALLAKPGSDSKVAAYIASLPINPVQ